MIAAERAWLDGALLALVRAREPITGGQGWYLSAAEARALLLQGGDWLEPPGPPLPDATGPLAHVVERFGLSRAERIMLAAALAGELDARYGRVFGFLQDDLTRSRPSLQIGLWLARLDAGASDPEQALLDPDVPLFRWGLVRLEGVGEARTTQAVALDPDVLSVLAGVPGAPAPAPPLPAPEAEPTARVRGLLRTGTPAVLHFHGEGAAEGARITLAACAAEGVPLIDADAAELLDLGDFGGALRARYRLALLHAGAVRLHGFDALTEAQVRVFARVAREAPCLTAVTSARPWAAGPVLGAAEFVPVHSPLPSYEDRCRAWQAAVPALDHLDAGTLAARFRLTTGAIAEAANGASGDALPELAMACASAGQHLVGELTRLVHPRARWADLVLPDTVIGQLNELCEHVRHRATVLHEWGFDHGASRGTGVAALFLGASGTGKTLAAEVVAGELGADLLHVDLAAVLSKYIGETEKHLERVLAAGDSAGAILLFDEADALFGRRSEVRDAHDRYANLELSFLLQRLEQYEGVAILASNFAQNIDPAFMRRIRMTIELPMPDEDARRRLWEVHLPESAPVGGDVDVAYLARAFKLPGGAIRKIALNAAFLAAAHGEDIELEHLLRAARREYDRSGRPFPALEAAA